MFALHLKHQQFWGVIVFCNTPLSLISHSKVMDASSETEADIFSVGAPKVLKTVVYF